MQPVFTVSVETPDTRGELRRDFKTYEEARDAYNAWAKNWEQSYPWCAWFDAHLFVQGGGIDPTAIASTARGLKVPSTAPDTFELPAMAPRR